MDDLGEGRSWVEKPNVEVLHHDRDWAIYVCGDMDERGEEIWDRVIVCIKNCMEVAWEEVNAGIVAMFNETPHLEWVEVNIDRAFIFCLCMEVAGALCEWGLVGSILGDPDFIRWSPYLFAINYGSLFKR